MKLEIRALRRYQPGRVTLPAGFGLVGADGMQVLVEVAAPYESPADWRRLGRYREALQAWWQNGELAVLPLRAGPVFSGPQEIVRLLRERLAEFEAKLDRVEGQVQLGLRSLLPQSGPDLKMESGSSSGWAYMQLLAKRQAVQQTWLSDFENIVNQLAPLAIDRHYQPPNPGDVMAQAAFLLKKDQVASFRVALPKQSYQLTLGEPLPPFSFVEE